MLGGLFNDVSQQVVSLYPLRTIFGLRQVNFNGEYKRISVDATNLAFDDVVQHVMFLFPALRGKPFSVRYQDEEGAFPRLFLTTHSGTAHLSCPEFHPTMVQFSAPQLRCFQNAPLFAPR